MGVVASFVKEQLLNIIIIIIIKLGKYIIKKVKVHNEKEKINQINYCNINNYSYICKSC